MMFEGKSLAFKQEQTVLVAKRILTAEEQLAALKGFNLAVNFGKICVIPTIKSAIRSEILSHNAVVTCMV